MFGLLNDIVASAVKIVELVDERKDLLIEVDMERGEE